ncbi:MAG: cyclopropane-fatty-acyl-phospholipid synthase [Alphaproteobacteria bacterium HGW-Alphaproteobacteria-18]|nr:MAG: cyclopropane-fatty-acyl-phospholipid synthase [Alphaproteobacteria bacterium HGW-Alphaproteobacteria-18]
MGRAGQRLSALLEDCGVVIGGDRPWDVQVHDPRVFERVFSQGTLGLGEAYMDGWWDCDALDQLFSRLLKSDIQSKLKVDLVLMGSILKGRFLNHQRSKYSEVGEVHYDTGNDLFERMLDKRMIYSCGYWAAADHLDDAQEAKLDLICRKLSLQPGQRLLDIGSGWGGLLKYAAEKYGVTGVGVTISKEQAALANATRGNLPIETKLMDYMSLEGQFDRIVSVGMFEHVGHKNYRAYLEKVRSLLGPSGLFLLHTIGGNETVTHGDPWIEKYIFPHGMLPSPQQITKAVGGNLIIEDWHNFGADYDLTLMAWLQNFDAAWPDLSDRYDERFRRMWRYYLMSCAALFRVRQAQLWQIVLSADGVDGGYLSVR